MTATKWILEKIKDLLKDNYPGQFGKWETVFKDPSTKLADELGLIVADKVTFERRELDIKTRVREASERDKQVQQANQQYVKKKIFHEIAYLHRNSNF